MTRFLNLIPAKIAGLLAITAFAASAAIAAPAVPAPAVDMPAATGKRTETAVLAGGCFWGIEAVFEHVKGVTNVTRGYAGGTKETAKYEIVSSGRPAMPSPCEITYDPSQISYGELLQVFFSVAHDPTELNRQGPDDGHAISLGDLLRERRTEESRAGLYRAAERGQGLSRNRS